MQLFPQELIEETMHGLSDDPMSLRACSLVESTWKIPSQHVLFSSIAMHEKGTADSFLNLVSMKPQFAVEVGGARGREGMAARLSVDAIANVLTDIMAVNIKVKLVHSAVIYFWPVQVLLDVIVARIYCSLCVCRGFLSRLSPFCDISL
jgi:hypothetical protein